MSRRTLVLRAIALAFIGLASIETVACSSDDKADDGGGGSGASGGGGGSAGTVADSGSDAGGSGGSDTIPTYPLEWLACETDADCVVVQQKSCVACVTVSTNVAHEQDTITFYEEVRLGCDRITSAPCPPKPDIPICVEGKCDFEVDCDVMERALLCTELGKCSALVGEPCNPGDGGGAPVRVGCYPRVEDIVREQTCAQNPETGAKLVFPSNELPTGWTACDISACSL